MAGAQPMKIVIIQKLVSLGKFDEAQLGECIVFDEISVKDEERSESYYNVR